MAFRLKRGLRYALPVLIVLAATACAGMFPSVPRDDAGRDSGGRAGEAAEAGRPGVEPVGASPAQPERTSPGDADRQIWRVIAQGDQSAVRIPVRRAVADPSVWYEVWAAIHSNVMNPPPLPAVDFARETVIVLLLGERRTGGYAVSIGSIAVDRNVVDVEVAVRRPGAEDMVTLALTAPYQLAAIPFAAVTVIFSGDDVETGFEGD